MWDGLYDEWHEYDAQIDRSPSSANFLLYQEDSNVSSDSEDLRSCTPLYSTSQRLQRRRWREPSFAARSSSPHARPSVPRSAF
jgi:hypothetical protein